MGCTRPIEAYRCVDGLVRQGSGKGRYLDLPVVLSCGNCYSCRRRRRLEWAMRLTHHAMMPENDPAMFITLTYRNEDLPFADGLLKADFKAFIKRLRARVQYEHRCAGTKPPRLSYYHCGEYGPGTDRPHYHAILYGYRYPDQKFLKKSKGGYDIFTSEILDDRDWQKGYCQIGSVSPESVSYTAGYIIEKITGQEATEAYLASEAYVDYATGELVEKQHPYQTCSTRPAIGKTWIETYWKDVYPHDYVVFQGKKRLPPRYYDRWLAKHKPEVYATVKSERARRVGKFTHEADLTEERLEQRDVHDRLVYAFENPRARADAL